MLKFKRPFMFLILLIFAPLSAISQTSTNITTWGDRGTPFRIVYMNGMAVERYDSGSFTIDVLPPMCDKHHVHSAFVGVINRGPVELDIDPNLFVATANDSAATVLPLKNGDEEVAQEKKSADRRVKGAAMAGAFGTAFQTQNATVYNSNGTTSTVSFHDSAATQRVLDDESQRLQSNDRTFGTLADHVLRHNTVQPGHYASGRVYFSSPKGLDKKASIATIDVCVSGKIYRFRWDGTKPRDLER